MTGKEDRQAKQQQQQQMQKKKVMSLDGWLG
jgi:hypothetical protein